MNFYEYLRKLYIKELIILAILTLLTIIYFYSITSNTAIYTLGVFGLLPMFIELIMLNFMGKIDSHRPLVIPRTIHFVVYYAFIVFISFIYEPLKYEWLLMIPLGMSGMIFHPFFGRKINVMMFIIGLATSIVLIYKDIFMDPILHEFGQHNMIFIVFIFSITSSFIYLSLEIQKKSEELLRRNKESLKENISTLSETSSKLDSITYQIVHDFRSHVSLIDLDLMKIKEVSTEKSVEYYADSGSSKISNLSYLIDKLYDFSANEVNEKTLQPTDLNHLIMQITQDRKNLFAENQIELDFEPFIGDFVYTDKQKLKSIIENLIDNSIKYADENKQNKYVSIKIKSVPDGLNIKMNDNGIGIAKDKIKNIFNLFYRANQNREGAGMGLYIVKEALLKLGGSINVESKEGEGSKFDIFIPA